MNRRPRAGRSGTVVAAIVGLSAGAPAPAGGQQVEILDTQIQYNRGQNVAPLYEGWIRNPDGTFDLWFGYLNRNYEEVLHVPVGPDNRIEPGGPDRGQPTVFVPRRRTGGAVSRRESYVFRVTAPADFGEEDELIWTVRAHGKTDRAVGTLLDVYALEGPPDGNAPPTAGVAADRTSAAAGETVTLTAAFSDDGRPEDARERAGVRWRLHRGPGPVTFDPPRSPFPEGEGIVSGAEASTRATFGAPGTYVVRAEVNDGDVNPAGWPRVPSTTFASVTVDVAPTAAESESAAAQEPRTVWDGIYTEAQAVRGEQVYQDDCTFCHLDDLRGDAFATPLVDDAFTFRWEGVTIGELATIIQVTMPADNPATLGDEAVADVIAFLLKMNDYPAGDDELPADPDALRAITVTPAP